MFTHGFNHHASLIRGNKLLKAQEWAQPLIKPISVGDFQIRKEVEARNGELAEEGGRNYRKLAAPHDKKKHMRSVCRGTPAKVVQHNCECPFSALVVRLVRLLNRQLRDDIPLFAGNARQEHLRELFRRIRCSDEMHGSEILHESAMSEGKNGLPGCCRAGIGEDPSSTGTEVHKLLSCIPRFSLTLHGAGV